MRPWSRIALFVLNCWSASVRRPKNRRSSRRREAMKRIVIVLCVALTCVEIGLAVYCAAAASAPQPLSKYVLVEPLLYLEAKDFSALLSDWNSSPQKRQWTQSSSAAAPAPRVPLSKYVPASRFFIWRRKISRCSAIECSPQKGSGLKAAAMRSSLALVSFSGCREPATQLVSSPPDCHRT